MGRWVRGGVEESGWAYQSIPSGSNRKTESFSHIAPLADLFYVALTSVNDVIQPTPTTVLSKTRLGLSDFFKIKVQFTGYLGRVERDELV